MPNELPINPIGVDRKAGGMPLVKPVHLSDPSTPPEEVNHAAGVAGAVPIPDELPIPAHPADTGEAGPGGMVKSFAELPVERPNPADSAKPTPPKGGYKLVRGPAPGDRICQ